MLERDGAAASHARLEQIQRRSFDCVHCGLCLPACPTYRETGREISSPRGRIYLMRGAAEGEIPFGAALAEELYLCLGCRACETACPSGVRFGEMLEAGRAEVEARGLRRGFAKRIEQLALRHVLPQRARLNMTFSLLRAVQHLWLMTLAQKILPQRLHSICELLQPVPPRRARRRLPTFTPARGERRGRVVCLEGCVMPELYGDVNRATVAVLAENGFDVVVPKEQVCCGALHAHAGDPELAHALARKNRDVFAREEFDALITNSAGCGAALKEYGLATFGEKSEPSGTSETFARRVRDVAEFLDAVGLRPPTRRLELSVCYDAPCHLVHAQGVREAPLRLLAQIPGLRIFEHDDPESCCGAAGIYNLTHPEMSGAVLERKMPALQRADPDVIATGNPGCLMQLTAGSRQRSLRARVAHPVELLAAAYDV